MCLLTNERYKTYQTGFSFGHLSHAPGVGRGYSGGVEWSKQFFFPKFNQIWCVSYLHGWHMQQNNFLGPHPLGPWGGAKRSNIIKSQSQSQFKRFLNQTLCVFSQMKDITYQTGYSFRCLGHAPGVGLWETLGGWGSKIVFFSKFS